jgi:hypothetical protein
MVSINGMHCYLVVRSLRPFPGLRRRRSTNAAAKQANRSHESRRQSIDLSFTKQDQLGQPYHVIIRPCHCKVARTSPTFRHKSGVYCTVPMIMKRPASESLRNKWAFSKCTETSGCMELLFIVRILSYTSSYREDNDKEANEIWSGKRPNDVLANTCSLYPDCTCNCRRLMLLQWDSSPITRGKLSNGERTQHTL